MLKKEKISHISHEFKAFITSAKAYTQLAIRSIQKKEAAEKQLEYLTKVDNQLILLNSYLDDFFDVFRLSTNSINLSLETTTVEEIIAKAMLLVEKYDPICKITITKFSRVEIIADKKRLEKAFFHVLLNGVKFSREKSRVLVNAAKKNKSVIMSIQSTGKKIPQKEIDKIFEPFYQGDIQGYQKGFGIGLYFTKKILELHGGTVTIHSKKYRTTVIISLPILI